MWPENEHWGGVHEHRFRSNGAIQRQAIISTEQVCTDYFTHLTPDMFQRKVLAGQIQLPITRLEASQKSARGVHIADLAIYLD